MTLFTKAEQRSLMTLWSVFRSPLMFGGDLRYLGEWTLSLLTDPYLTDVHQEGRGEKKYTEKVILWSGYQKVKPENMWPASILRMNQNRFRIK